MARGAERGLRGIWAVARIDRGNPPVRVGGARWVDQRMICKVRIRLQPFGDVLAPLVANLQRAAQRTHGGMRTPSRNRQSRADARALPQGRREIDGLPEDWRRQLSDDTGMPVGASGEALEITGASTLRM